LFLGHPRRSN